MTLLYRASHSVILDIRATLSSIAVFAANMALVVVTAFARITCVVSGVPTLIIGLMWLAHPTPPNERLMVLCGSVFLASFIVLVLARYLSMRLFMWTELHQPVPLTLFPTHHEDTHA